MAATASSNRGLHRKVDTMKASIVLDELKSSDKLKDRLNAVGLTMSDLDDLSSEELTFLNELDLTTPDLTSTVDALYADWDRDPPTPEEFIYDPYFLGESALWPQLRDDFLRIFHEGFSEVICTGAIGWGKTYLAAAGTSYLVALLMCMRDPISQLGLDRLHPVYIANLSVSADQAKEGYFAYLKSFIQSSPFFKEEHHVEEYVDTLKLSDKIIAKSGSSSEFSAIGKNVICGVIDEANFLAGARRKSYELESGELSHAMVLYRALKRRMKSRLLGSQVSLFGHRFAGLMWMLSSKKYPDDFLEQHIGKLRRLQGKGGGERSLILDYHQWATRPEDDITAETFRVVIGGESSVSRILEADEESPSDPDVKVVDVPVLYRDDFDLDLEGSIRDIIGDTTVTVTPFIPRRDMVDRAAALGETVYRLHHPTKCPIPDHPGSIFGSSDLSTPWEKLFNVDLISQRVWRKTKSGKLIKDEMGRPVFSHWKPLLHSDEPRFARFDLAYSPRGDSIGFAMGHCAGTKDVTVKDDRTEVEYIEHRPVIVFDLMLQMVSSTNEELDLTYACSLMRYLTNLGFRFFDVSFDQFQSKHIMQMLENQGFRTSLLSVDRDTAAYEALKLGIMEGRVYLYRHPAAQRELKKLSRVITQSVTRKVKIEHPENDSGNYNGKGSKDVSDCLAGVTQSITLNLGRIRKPLLLNVRTAEQVKHRPQQPVYEYAWLFD